MPNFDDYNKCGMLKDTSNRPEPIKTWSRVETNCNYEAYKNYTIEELHKRRKEEVLKYKKNALIQTKKQINSYINTNNNIKNKSVFIKKGNTLICPYDYYYEWTKSFSEISDLSYTNNTKFINNTNNIGDIIALKNSDDNNNNYIILYKLINNIWTKHGNIIGCYEGTCTNNDINDFSNNDIENISLNSQGNIISVGVIDYDTNVGLVKTYIYNDNTMLWDKYKNDISNTDIDGLGFSTSLNDDGNILAVGSPYTSHNGIANVGSVITYKIIDDEWQQYGNTIFGDISGGNIGYIVKLNSVGNIMAVSSPDYSSGDMSNNGMINIYMFDQNDEWSKIGDSIIGTNKQYLGLDMDINSNGNIIAVSSGFHAIDNMYSGITIVYKLNSNNNWEIYGNKLMGTGNDYLGWSIKLNNKGNILAVGCPNRTQNNDQSIVDVFKYNIDNNTWELYGTTIKNNNTNNTIGNSVNINGEGDRIFVIDNNISNVNVVANTYNLNAYNIVQNVVDKSKKYIPLI